MLFVSCVRRAFASSVRCCLVVAWKKGTGLLAFVCDVYYDFVTSPFGVVLHCFDS